MKEQTLLPRIKEAIRSFDPEAEVILYGSRARGDAKEDSDWDILILTDGEAGFRKECEYLEWLFPLELETASNFSVIVRNRWRWHSYYSFSPFYRNVQKEGIRL